MKPLQRTHVPLAGVFVLLIGLLIVVLAVQERQDQRSMAAGEQTDRTNLSHTANGYTSEYHLYAAGLDWTKPVGMLIYTDGSGEYGLKNPGGTYLMAGPTGMIAVAKKHNMILLTPFSPNKACSDGDGSCWYQGDPPGYTKWAESLVSSVQSQYPIDKKRMAVGGYSSGATFTTQKWVPSGAAQRTMEDGVTVAISYGGSPGGSPVAFTAGFKTNVHMNWNTGDADEALASVQRGHKYYTDAGFQTSLDVLPGVGHDRNGAFGKIMDAQITKHVPASAGSSTGIPAQPTINPATTMPEPSNVVPSFVCLTNEPCTTTVPTQTATTTPPSGANPGTGTPPVGGTNPSPVPANPIPVVQPCPTDGTASVLHNKKKKKSGGGFIEKFIKFIMRLIELFFKLLGISIPNPAPTNPQPNPDPGTNPQPCSDQIKATDIESRTDMQPVVGEPTPTIFNLQAR